MLHDPTPSRFIILFLHLQTPSYYFTFLPTPSHSILLLHTTTYSFILLPTPLHNILLFQAPSYSITIHSTPSHSFLRMYVHSFLLHPIHSRFILLLRTSSHSILLFHATFQILHYNAPLHSIVTLNSIILLHYTPLYITLHSTHLKTFLRSIHI